MGTVTHFLLGLPAWLIIAFAFAMPALESSAFVGFVFPGEAALVVGGVVASQGRVSVAAVIAAGVVGAILGDAVGYTVGRRWGPALLRRLPRRFFPPERVEGAQAYLARRGGRAVFFGRFTATLRVLVPGLAGMSGVSYRRFAIANAAGALGWGVLSVLIGYLGGSSWQHLSSLVGQVGLAIVAVLLVGAFVAHRVRRHRAHTT